MELLCQLYGKDYLVLHPTWPLKTLPVETEKPVLSSVFSPLL